MIRVRPILPPVTINPVTAGDIALKVISYALVLGVAVLPHGLCFANQRMN